MKSVALRELLKSANLSIQDVAVAANFSPDALRRIADQSLPLPPEVRKVLKEAGIDLQSIEEGQIAYQQEKRAEVIQKLRRTADLL